MDGVEPVTSDHGGFRLSVGPPSGAARVAVEETSGDGDSDGGGEVGGGVVLVDGARLGEGVGDGAGEGAADGLDLIDDHAAH